MAQSRLEKIGTVYSRVTALLRGNAMREEDKPLWLAVYAAFPPKYEPRYDRQMPTKAIKPIFYKEDLIRAKFHKDRSSLPPTYLADGTEDGTKSATQNFLSIYKRIQKQEELSDDSAYEQAMREYTFELVVKKGSKKVENESVGNFK